MPPFTDRAYSLDSIEFLTLGQSSASRRSQVITNRRNGRDSYIGAYALSPDLSLVALGLIVYRKAPPISLTTLPSLSQRTLYGTLTPEQTMRIKKREDGDGQMYLDWLAFSPDQKLLAAESNERLFSLWDVKSGKQIFQTDRILRDLPRGIVTGSCSFWGGTFSPDGKLVALLYSNCAVLWDVSTRTTRHAVSFDDLYGACNFTPDGKFFVVAGAKRAQVWKLETLPVIKAKAKAD